MSQSLVARLVSGGQSGVDRAALDAAIAAGVAYGGWCPAGGWSEDYPTPPGVLESYPDLRETASSDPDLRTRLNVRDSHATLVIREDHITSLGTALTVRTADRLQRPCLVTEADPRAVTAWLEDLGWELTLNVAGPRESEQPGAYAATRALLRQVLGADGLRR